MAGLPATSFSLGWPAEQYPPGERKEQSPLMLKSLAHVVPLLALQILLKLRVRNSDWLIYYPMTPPKKTICGCLSLLIKIMVRQTNRSIGTNNMLPRTIKHPADRSKASFLSFLAAKRANRIPMNKESAPWVSGRVDLGFSLECFVFGDPLTEQTPPTLEPLNPY